MYLYGIGVSQNYAKAKQYLEEAADGGNLDAKANLGSMYEQGDGVTQNYSKAKLYYEAAANGGNIFSQERLRIMEKKGLISNAKVSEISISSVDDINQLLSQTKQKKIDKRNFLIVIGAEDYDYTDNIAYSRHSAKMFTKVAQKTLGISKTNTLELTNKDATMGKIQMKMKKLLRRVKKGDTIYFYYSGHGIPVVSQKNTPYILPIDVEPEFISEAPFFKLQNIYKTLTNSKASKVIAFVDSCFSGATDGVSVIKGVAAARLKPMNVTFNKKKMVVMTAGKDKQYSNMYKEKGYRLFSYFLMESMLKGRTNIKDIYSDVYIKVKDKSYEMGDMKLQEPTMAGNTRLKL